MTPFGLGRSRRRGGGSGRSDVPVLAVDIDGVISLFGFEGEPQVEGAELELIEGALHCISMQAGGQLRQLAEHFEIVWATGWETGGERVSQILGLPPWPSLSFKGSARFGSADWKLEPLGRHARGRPLAWIDDSLDEACYAWARARQEPTLLVETEPQTGLQQVQVEALLGWARSLEADSQGAAGPR
ncbi:MAG TPA: hypothetical protein VF255_10315 [Solirubrobacterales bacterium]